MIETIKLKLNVDLPPHKAGKILTLPSLQGLPRDSYWSRRLRDAKRDNCVEIVSNVHKPVENKEEAIPSETPPKPSGKLKKEYNK